MLRTTLLILTTLSCSAVHRPPEHSASWDGGLVRSGDSANALRVAKLLSELAPAVAHALGSPPPPFIQVWLLPTEIPGAPAGRTVGDRIEVGREAEGEEAWLIAHEFAHWCMASDPQGRWNELPQLVMEGLAELAAARALPSLAAEGKAAHVSALERIARIGSIEEAFGLDAEQWGKIQEEDLLRVLYAMGFVLAARLGPDGLATRCSEARMAGLARVPSNSILASAGLKDASPEEWVRAGGQAWGDLEATSSTGWGFSSHAADPVERSTPEALERVRGASTDKSHRLPR